MYMITQQDFKLLSLESEYERLEQVWLSTNLLITNISTREKHACSLFDLAGKIVLMAIYI